MKSRSAKELRPPANIHGRILEIKRKPRELYCSGGNGNSKSVLSRSVDYKPWFGVHLYLTVELGVTGDGGKGPDPFSVQEVKLYV